ncbi:uncharacterized protein LOC126338559 [Schistocerca gregaria]|uniref:uncharacterized protein LOC126338559 n=1 Tax=Schistocerca gregaria TaxID=7010 RepID=UPI00211ED4B3|nr:uncharacterized protein LOC126338559 [Schistocerca gregaria]
MDKIKLYLPSQALRTVYSFKNAKLKLTKVICSVKFNKECVSHGFIPNYINITKKWRSQAARIATKKFENNWLRTEIKLQHKQKEELNRALYHLHLELTSILHPLEMYYVDEYVTTLCTKVRTTITDKHSKKLESLKEKYDSAHNNVTSKTQTFYERVINETNISFTNTEQALLNKGLKHNIKPKFNHHNLKNLIVDTKKAADMANLNHNEQIVLAHKVNEIIQKEEKKAKQHSNPTFEENKVLKQLKHKLNEHDALVVKSDKGNSTVILYKNDYITKTLNFFAENNITELNHDPTTKFQKKLKKMLNQCNFLLSDKQIKGCTLMNPTAPKLRAQPKIHKQNSPIRPIVNSKNTPAYKLSQLLNNILREFYTFETTYTVKNAHELTTLIKDIKIPGEARFASFDIVNLFTNIPVKDTIEIIRKNLIIHKKLTIPEITELVDLLELVLSHNYFSFNNKIYQQKEGLAMGNCMSSFLADIFINHLENKFFKGENKLVQKIVYYKRYVDDTLLLFDGTKDELEELLTSFNSLHNKIKFTIEHETNQSINFLDLTIVNEQQEHNLYIYRKPTYTDITIHESSHHPNTHKYAAFRSMLNRAHTLPLKPKALTQEIDTIKTIAINNGYSVKSIDKLSKKIQTNIIQKNTEKITTDTKQIFTSIPYLGTVSQKIANLFKKTNIKISFSTNSKLGYHLPHTVNTNKPITQHSGIYKLQCNSCPAFYIGKTGRTFHTRYKEHTDAFRLNHFEKSTIANHMYVNKHRLDNIHNSLTVLHTEPNSKKLSLLEQLEIMLHKEKYPQNLLNEQTEFNSHNFFYTFKSLFFPEESNL